jgi:PAS domain S-box-containing protein/putative nucleotidyltransferase with HDIG domain
MKDKDKTHEQLIKEVTSLRRRIAELEGCERQQKKTEDTLTKWAQEKTAILDSMSELVAYQDTRMRILWVNKAAAESVGVDPQQLVGRHCYEIWPQRQRPCVGCPVVKARKSGRPHEAEITTPDGRVWLIRGYPVRDTKGNITGTVEVTLEITERKKSEEEINRLASFPKLNPIPIVEVDPKGQLIYTNPAAQQIFPNLDKKQGKHPFLAGLKPTFLELKETKEKYLFREIKTGRTWYSQIISLVDSEHIRIYAVDITERKQIEEEKLASENLYKTLFNSASDAVLIINMAGQFIDVNEVACQRLGYRKEELLQMSPMDIDSPEYAPLVQERIKQLRQHGHFFFETAHVRRDGTIIPTELSSRVIEYNGKPAVLSIARDITERKQVEEKLRESEERYKTLFEEAVIGTCLTDAKTGIIVDCNQELASLVGRERVELIGKSQKILHPPEYDKKLFSPTYKQHLKDKQGEILETQVITKAGDLREVAIKANFLHLQGKKMLLGLFLDITDRKRAEEQLQQLTHDLAERVKELNCLSIASKLMVEPDKSLNEIYQSIVHLIPPAWQYTDITCARITYGDRQFKTDNFKETKWKQSADIIVDSNKVGSLDVFYLQKKPEEHEGPFLKEERDLLDALAREIEVFIKRKQAGDALRESEVRFRTLFEGIPDTLLVHDDEGTILHINEVGAQQLEWSAKDLVGRNLREIVTPENAASIADHVKEVHKAGWCRFETTYVSRSGWQIAAEVNEHPIKFGRKKAILSVARDITERKRAEDKLRETSLFLRNILDSSSPISIISTDLEQNILFWNKGAEDIFGYKAEEVINRHTVDILYPDEGDTKQTVEEIRSYILNKKRELCREIKEITKDGRILWINLTSTPRFDENKNVIGILGIGEDITERKSIEDALRESEERFRRVVETMGVGLSAIDANGVLTYVNEYLAKMLGYSINEMIGRSTLDFYEKKSRKIQEEIFKKRRAGMRDPTSYEVIWRKKDGQKVHSILSPTPMFDADGHYTGSFAIHTDITVRKRMEQELRESEEKYRELINGMNDTAWVIDFDGNFIDVNDAAVEVLGYSREELLAMGPHDIDSSLDAKTITDLIKGMATDKMQVFETSHTTKDGKPIPVEIKSSLITYQGKQAILSIARDITKRKQAEEALRENEEKLKNIVENSTNIFYSHTPDHILTYHSPQVKDMLGYEPDEAMMKWTELASDNPINEEGLKLTERAIKTGKPQPPYELELNHKNGKKVWVEVREAPVVVNGKTILIVGALTDITERKKAEEDLHKNEAVLKEALVAAQMGIWHWFPETDSVVWDENLYRIAGRDSKLPAPSYAEHPQVYTLESWQRLKAAVENALQTGTPYQLDLELIRPDGSRRWVIGRGEALRDTTGRIVQFRGTVQDITERKKAEEKLQNSYLQMQEMLVTTVNALASTVEMKDQYTAGHQPRVTQLACAIAEEMGLPEEQIEGIRMAGLIHDIGKIMVPAEILNKPGRLTEIQYEMVKMHPQAGYDILVGIKFPWPVAEIVLQHHELIDGSGYPEGLSGDEILLEARILTVANVVEAMISHRPYRSAYDIKEALAEISKNKRVLYDPDVVDACQKLFAEKRFAFEQVQ